MLLVDRVVQVNLLLRVALVPLVVHLDPVVPQVLAHLVHPLEVEDNNNTVLAVESVVIAVTLVEDSIQEDIKEHNFLHKVVDKLYPVSSMQDLQITETL